MEEWSDCLLLVYWKVIGFFLGKIKIYWEKDKYGFYFIGLLNEFWFIFYFGVEFREIDKL